MLHKLHSGRSRHSSEHSPRLSLQEVDVNGELSTARSSIDRLTQQVALLMREREVSG